MDIRGGSTDGVWSLGIYGVYNRVSNQEVDEEKAFLNFCAKIAERYPEFVFIIKTPDGSRAWKFSDTNWAVGAMTRMLKDIETQDLMAHTEAQDGAG